VHTGSPASAPPAGMPPPRPSAVSPRSGSSGRFALGPAQLRCVAMGCGDLVSLAWASCAKWAGSMESAQETVYSFPIFELI
jgi:hypothetical protein